MSPEALAITVLLGLLILVMVIPAGLGRRPLFKQAGLARTADGAILIRRERGMLVSMLAWFALIGMMSFAADGWLQVLMCAGALAGVLGTGLAFRHQLILSEDRMTVRRWRCLAISRSEILSCHVERSDDDGRMIWIDVRSAQGNCRLGLSMMHTCEQQQAVLAFLRLQA